jgi:hypothetical protein
MKIQDLIESSRRRDEAATKGPWVNAYPNACQLTPMPDHVWSMKKELIGKDLETNDAEFISASRTSEPLFREIAAVAVEAIHCEDCYPTPCNQCEACEALSKIQSLIDEAEKTK